MNYEKAYVTQIEKYKALQKLYKTVCLDRDDCISRINQLQAKYDAEHEESKKLIEELQQLTKELNQYKLEYNRINREYLLLLNRMIGAIDDMLV